LRPAHLCKRVAEKARAACAPAKMALGRGLQALPSLAERGLKTTVERWWRR
jgi:hypothetical protein